MNEFQEKDKDFEEIPENNIIESISSSGLEQKSDSFGNNSNSDGLIENELNECEEEEFNMQKEDSEYSEQSEFPEISELENLDNISESPEDISDDYDSMKENEDRNSNVNKNDDIHSNNINIREISDNFNQNEANKLSIDEGKNMNSNKPELPIQNNDPEKIDKLAKEAGKQGKINSQESEIVINVKENDQFHDNILKVLKIGKNKELDYLFYKNFNLLSKKDFLSLEIHFPNPLTENKEFKIPNLPFTIYNILPPRRPDLKYSQQHSQLILANMVIFQQIRKINSDIKEYLYRIYRYNKIPNDIILSNQVKENHQNIVAHSMNDFLEQKRRHRRMANQIERRYKCHIEGCGKSYG